MLAEDIIEPATSKWPSPVVLVPKRDGGMRFCVDYRKLNNVTERDVYPLPRLDECIDSLGDSVVFSTLDANSGYWQVSMHPNDRDKTTFACHVGTYRFKRMPFGLRNAPSTVQRTLDVILPGARWQKCLCYLDEIIVFSSSMKSHVEGLDKVLSLLRDAGISLRLDKCHFFRRRVNYLGHVIEPGKLSVQDTKVDTILMAKLPRTKTELRAFLGICNVYRRFVLKFATIDAPLTRHLLKDYPDFFDLEENSDAVTAFEKLRSMITSPLTLALPKQGLEYVLDTDATERYLSACLKQRDEHGVIHPIGYWSRQLSPTDRRYHITEKEAYAVYWAVKLLRSYLEGNLFTVRTDHSALTWLFNADGNSTPRLARWRLVLEQFDFIVKYRSGVQNQPADGASRLVAIGHDIPAVEDDIPCCEVADDATKESVSTPGPPLEDAVLEPITLHELIDAQAQDPFCL
jgi:RNase H-like domain found in reverse transcriptase/Reverse transcriptase (RNA-dependent DNA polymerase)